MKLNQEFDYLSKKPFFLYKTLEDLFVYEDVNYWVMIEWILFNNYSKYSNNNKSIFNLKMGKKQDMIIKLSRYATIPRLAYRVLIKYFYKFLLRNNVPKPHSILLLFQNVSWDNELKRDRNFHSVLKIDDSDFAWFSPSYSISPKNIFIDIERVKNNNIPMASESIFFNAECAMKNVHFVKQMNKSLRLIKKNKDFKLEFNKLYPVYEQFIKDLEFTILILLPYLNILIYCMNSMIEHIKPNKLVVMNENSWWERAIIHSAKMNGVHTVALQHGIIFPQDRILHYDSEFFKNNKMVIPDNYLVFGEHFKKVLTQKGRIDTKKVVVTGHPRYDSYKANDIEMNNVYLYALTFFHLEHPELEMIVENIKEKLDDENVLIEIKPHPMDTVESIILFFNQFRNEKRVILLPKTDKIESHFPLINTIVGRDSTVLLEAMLSGVDVEFFDPLNNSLLDDEMKAFFKKRKYSNLNYFISNNSGRKVYSFLKKERSE